MDWGITMKRFGKAYNWIIADIYLDLGRPMNLYKWIIGGKAWKVIQDIKIRTIECEE